MSWTSRSRLPLAAVVIAAASLGCDRGCLARKVGELQDARASAGFSLDDLDCPDGLARCVDGEIEASRLGRVPAKCTGAACACPWDHVAMCATGCVANGAEIVMDPTLAAAQLCLPAPSDAFLRPALENVALPPCDAARPYICVNGLVAACREGEGAEKALAICANGCAREGETLDDDVGEAAATMLLCARSRR